ncbi:MAG: DUF655 domain-containing protein [Methanimicrococcus sp.]|nr:DUF655 domain-containing protein [Methanimicrococcus sp.]
MKKKLPNFEGNVSIESAQSNREKWVWILDYLPYGRENDTRPVDIKKPFIHALSDNKLILMELIPVEGKIPQVRIKTHIGEQNEEFIARVKSRITYKELSQRAKIELPIVLEKYVKVNESRFIKFFNDANYCGIPRGFFTSERALCYRSSSLQLLPGIGYKLTEAIIKEAKKYPFKSFADLRWRINYLPNPETILVKRILEEIQGSPDGYYLFAESPPKKREEGKTKMKKMKWKK